MPFSLFNPRLSISPLRFSHHKARIHAILYDWFYLMLVSTGGAYSSDGLSQGEIDGVVLLATVTEVKCSFE